MSEEKDFIGIFKSETEEHLTEINKGLVELEKNPDNIELVRELNRQAHTIKGSARVFGFHEIQEIAHRIEDIFDKISSKQISFNSDMAQAIFKALDAINIILDRIINDKDVDVDISNICERLEFCIYKKESVKDKPKEKTAILAEAKVENKKEKRKQPATLKFQNQSSEKTSHLEEYIRVPVSRVNNLLNLVGEMVINKMKSSRKIVQVKRLSKMAKDMQKRFSDLQEKVKRIPSFNDMEVIKLFSQCNIDIQRLKEDVLSLYDDISTEAFRLDPVIDELQNRMKEIRMLPCLTIFDAFPRMIRDIAQEAGKEVNLEISGQDTELDKKVLEGIKTPIMHILRNCIDHGIEDPQRRKELKKPEFGTIKISASHEAGSVTILIEDDGRGINPDFVKEVALKKKLVSSEDLESMSEREILNLIFMNGFSTSPIITDVSGRGIGLDVVRRDIENLKGQVKFETKKDEGTKFYLILPLTIAIIQVLLIRVKGSTFAFPMLSIEETIKSALDDIPTVEGRMAIQVRGHTVPVVKLSDVLQMEFQPEDERRMHGSLNESPVVITSSLEKKVGFIVDEIIGEEEIFIKSLGSYLGKVKNVMGSTILGTGEVIVILDVSDLIIESALSHPAVMGRKIKSEEAQEKKKNMVLIVEDSLSTRELEKSILEARGFQVDTAVDGLDGLDKLTQVKYDLVVADVQMPRMDGFEFCKTMRKNEEYRDIPVIIVSALGKEEDKRRGIEVGAQAYIVKTAFDQTNLLDTVDRLIG